MNNFEFYKNLSLENIIDEIYGVVYNEEWKYINGCNNVYQISSFGRIKSMTRTVMLNGGKKEIKGQIMKPFLLRGYVRVTLRVNGKTIKVSPHTLCLSHFLCEKPNDSVEVNHKDGLRHNNHVSNLEWATKSENLKHSFRVLGRKPTKFWEGKTGYSNHSSKEVLCLTNNILYGSTMDAAIALNVDRRMISAVCLNKRTHTGGYKFKYTS